MTDFGMPYLMDCETIEECAALADELKLRFVEINIGFPDCLPGEGLVKRLNALRERYGIYFTMHMDEQADPFSVNQTVREAWFDVFREAIGIAVKTGIPVINMHLPRGSWVTLPTRKVFIYEQYAYDDQVIEFRDMCEQMIADTGIMICVENTSGFLPFEKRAVEMLLDSPVFGLTLDIGHCHAAGNADESFYLDHSSRLTHMHAHDTLGTKDHLPFGKGEIDLRGRLSWGIRENARILVEVKTPDALRETIRVLPEYL